MRRFGRLATIVVATTAMVGVLSTSAWAADPAVSSYESNGVRYFESSSMAAPANTKGGPGNGTNLYSTHTGSGWKVEWKNVISSNVGAAQWVRYLYAHSKRLTGTGNYKVNAHATLIKGASYSGEQVFSVFTHSCAGKTVTNATATTCQSPQFSTSPGNKWYVVSGHWYDHGNNGSQDATCPGCIDWVWTASSS